MRADNTARASHTHHFVLNDGAVTAIDNGYRVTGMASITTNGAFATFSDSPLTIDVAGGSAVRFANVGVTFGGAAAAHFGTEPIDGVAVYNK